VPRTTSAMTGSAFYQAAAAYNWKQRDSFAIEQIVAGNLPSFLLEFVAVPVSVMDSASGKVLQGIIYVSPDYLSVGNHQDWARVPLTPMAAQQIAEKFNCMLPDQNMVDAIYKAASVKLTPVPLFAFRDSTPTMYHHHLIIEGQRKNRKGLIAGIKKDVLNQGPDGKVTIYGWHKLDGKPIQPVYSGHVNWYVDYSHGIRLVYKKMRLEGRWVEVGKGLGVRGLQENKF
jgi:hypothetical protein